MAAKRPNLIPMNRRVTLCEPPSGGERNLRNEIIPGTETIVKHNNIPCNYMANRVTEDDATGIIAADIEATLIFRWSPLLVRLTGDWRIIFNNTEYEPHGPGQEVMGLRKYIRIHIRRTGR